MPSIWKQSIVVPVPKISTPKTLNDFRPVALTSQIMKQFEKLVKLELVAKTVNQLDPFQFAYRENRGVQDATVTLLNLLFKHLEGSKNHARLLFIDFSSAFNTIQPHVLVEKLINNFGLDLCLVGWILDFSTNKTLGCTKVPRSNLPHILFLIIYYICGNVERIEIPGVPKCSTLYNNVFYDLTLIGYLRRKEIPSTP